MTSTRALLIMLAISLLWTIVGPGTIPTGLAFVTAWMATYGASVVFYMIIEFIAVGFRK